MKFKSIIITVLGFAGIGFSLPAHANECQQYFQSGRTYGTFHQGRDLAFSGKIQVQRTYDCPQGTCFSAEMTFDNYNNAPDVATGFWSGSTFELRRFVGAGNNTQIWSGQCKPNSVRGDWYIENERSNNGTFSITY
jgi:hypothetical protein